MSGATDGRPVMYGDPARWVLVQADSLKLLPELPEASVEAVVTDPPYGIGFGNEAWDSGALTDAATFQQWTAAWAGEALRALKPGGWLAAFGTPRTFHRLVAGIEQAGFEIRDQLLWLYAQGVPKSPPRTDGLGSTLKPAYEPVLLARKPMDGTLDANLATHGTGALWIDAARVPRQEGGQGFWPANVTLSHGSACRDGRCQPECPVALIDTEPRPGREISRLFYASKATRREREAGCEALPLTEVPIYPRGGGAARLVRNTHPTVKPLELMRWLARLVCPPGGTVLDPFTGSGSTGAACMLEGRRFVGIERDERYVPVARARIEHWAAETGR
ncbi:MAG TPA: site-specific DNA-methyltransferase [Solirubrobacteraceae bacterium]|jgi:site-specific DNA-methyltransferase (adenine-specific)|nr:site-specific DNA-methyltransferase [Solirubrobacteraceae bacterium]